MHYKLLMHLVKILLSEALHLF